MKRKLWIAWGVNSILAIMMGLLGITEAAYVFAFIAGGFGWAAFLI